MDMLSKSWGSISPKRAAEFLTTYGAPSEGSKRLLLEVLQEHGGGRRLSLLDLGCGNAHLCAYLRAEGLTCAYTGVDVSEPLLEAARSTFAGEPDTTFVAADVNTLDGVTGRYDVAVYSHVLEILASPEASLLAARGLADSIAIRFFEPPERETDLVEIRELDTGDGGAVPYIRRTMGRDYYRMMLAKLGCTRVDVYQDETAKDQIHVLHYG
jgi:SAM-dependent methyltransferase